MLRRLVALVLMLCFGLFTAEALLADVHDGDATHAELVRIDGDRHAERHAGEVTSAAGAEQVPGESYPHGSRLKAYVVSVARTFRGPQVTISRTHPNLVRKLFALEVPEIADGSVEIVAVAREAGHRSKIAVRSTVPGLNAKGACIGPMGQRVRNVMSELHGEKIDIVEHAEDPAQMIANALSPAKTVSVEVLDADQHSARAVVPEHQLSLAIGKEGQNARLAAKLTGWRIDIVGDGVTTSAPGR